MKPCLQMLYKVCFLWLCLCCDSMPEKLTSLQYSLTDFTSTSNLYSESAECYRYPETKPHQYKMQRQHRVPGKYNAETPQQWKAS